MSMIFKTSSDRRSSRQLLLAVSGCISTFLASGAASAAPECVALAEVNNELYSVSSAGSVIAQFSNDGSKKRFAAISPDASKVAFVSDDDVHTVVVVDNAGHRETFPAEGSIPNPLLQPILASFNGDLSSVLWATNDLVQVAHSEPRHSNKIFFHRTLINPNVNLANPIPSSLSQLTALSFNAESCAVAAISNKLACIQGRDVSDLSGIMLSFPEFSTTGSIATFSISVGGSKTTQTDPSLTVAAVAATRDTFNKYTDVTLRVSTPAGNWIESRLVAGEIMRIDNEDVSLGVRLTSLDKATGTIVIDILSRLDARYDGMVTWRSEIADSVGSSFVAAFHRGDGASSLTSARSLVVVEPKVSTSGQLLSWSINSSFELPIFEPILRLKGMTNTYMLAELKDRFSLFRLLPVVNPDFSLGVGPSEFSELPKTLTIAGGAPMMATGHVYDWTCKAQQGTPHL